ncbi:hypothetical protein CHS0354_040078 [Potamilus streckersoni]|uniref:Uncharacterized protein n=1 Tax=Potamilus streckersoni TaxID=2493646 RepID=A0AAE0W0N9_9BIVA|nr:hypothetical protein CHS0354_040078 [Potamilus streckersoni]
MAGTELSPLPRWVRIWFWISSVFVFFDATFCVFRPHTLPGTGGILAMLYYPYKYYIMVDRRYGDATDSFSLSQGLCNYVEIVLNIIALNLPSRYVKETKLTAFMASTMTMWKSFLYLLMFYDLGGGDSSYRENANYIPEFIFAVIPVIIWIIVPLIIIRNMWKDIVVQNDDNAYENEEENYEKQSMTGKYNLRQRTKN